MPRTRFPRRTVQVREIVAGPAYLIADACGAPLYARTLGRAGALWRVYVGLMVRYVQLHPVARRPAKRICDQFGALELRLGRRECFEMVAGASQSRTRAVSQKPSINFRAPRRDANGLLSASVLADG